MSFKLDRQGWDYHSATAGGSALVDRMREISFSLGSPRKLSNNNFYEIISPKLPSAARPGTFSSIFGRGDFPFHTEMAHSRVPPRYLILGCEATGDRKASTEVLDVSQLLFSPEIERSLQVAPFLIKDGRSSFYSNVRSQNGRVFRYDPVCMKPMTREAHQITETFSTAMKISHFSVEWEKGGILIVDNWRTLHRRSGVDASSGRKLVRMLVDDR